MSNSKLNLSDIYERSVDEIAQHLECAVAFLCEYESLKSQNISLLDEHYDDIVRTQDCFRSSISKAYHISYAFQSVFFGSEYFVRLHTIYDWSFQLYLSIDVFSSVDHYKNLITCVAANSRNGTLETPPSKLKEAA